MNKYRTAQEALRAYISCPLTLEQEGGSNSSTENVSAHVSEQVLQAFQKDLSAAVTLNAGEANQPLQADRAAPGR